jgi:heat shock protein HtpX
MQSSFVRQKRYNFWRTILLFMGMLGLMLLLGYLLFGVEALVWVGIVGVGALYVSSRLPTRYIMRLHRARPLSPVEVPMINDVVRQLTARAGLERAPQLYYIPSTAINAFATGQRHDPAIAITYGLLRQLDIREITGVLAHEMSHIHNNDFRFQSIVNLIGRLTRFFSFLGQILLFINLPLILMGEPVISWYAVLLLIIAPALSTLMMLSISRTREFDADLEASRLTGDPDGLANALQKLDHINGGMMRPIQKAVPKWLSTHPEMKERIRRLRALAPNMS